MLHGVGGHATHSSISLTGILAPEGLHSAAASVALRACQAGARRLLEARVDNLEAVATRAICGVALPEGNLPSLGKFGDFAMFVMTGGRERTVEEYRHCWVARVSVSNK